jgi:hypothetical protein
MGIRAIACTVAVLLLATATSLPQGDKQDVPDAAEFEAKPAKLPDGKNVWSVRMIRSGGLTGGTVTATLTSEGRLECQACDGRNVSKNLSRQALQTIAPSFDPKTSFAGSSVVKVVKPGQKVPRSFTSLCRDCFVTRITVQHRDAEGKVETYFAYWDDVTAAGVPAELVKLAKDMVSLGK